MKDGVYFLITVPVDDGLADKLDEINLYNYFAMPRDDGLDFIGENGVISLELGPAFTIRQNSVTLPMDVEKQEKLYRLLNDALRSTIAQRYAIQRLEKFVLNNFCTQNEATSSPLSLEEQQIYSVLSAKTDQQIYQYIVLMSSILSSLHDNINKKDYYQRLEEVFELIAQMLEISDYETAGHSKRVVQISALFADTIGFPYKKELMLGALVHDVGKIIVPSMILNKPARLEEKEWELMKQHVRAGELIIKNLPDVPEVTLNVVRYHHERWDGSGYLRGLKGEEIPLEARLFAIVDVYDALAHERPYKKPWTKRQIKKYFIQNKNKLFDPELVDVFVKKIMPQL